MRILIGKLFVFVLLINFFCFPSTQHAAEKITNGQIVLTSSATPAEQAPVNPQSKDSGDLSRRDIYEIIFGTFLSITGLALIALSLLRWTANDLSLISFGILCFLYGARTRAFYLLFDIPLLHYIYTLCFITYVIPIPAIVLDAINRVLCGKRENDFVTAGYLFLDIEGKNMIYAGAGYMPLLLWRATEQKIYEFRESGFA